MWYAAHVIMTVKFKEAVQDRYPLWENVYLVEASSADEALAKAAALGQEQEGDTSGTFCWEGTPATWVFAGVRKLIECRTSGDIEDKPTGGTEITYSQMIVDSEESLAKLVNGEPVTVLYQE
jgi:hypothetical protein